MVFTRDRDRDEERGEHVELGVTEAQQLFTQLAFVGGVAIEAIEAWGLALHGHAGTERHADPKTVAREAGIDTVDAFVQHVRTADLSRVPPDAASLHSWIERAQKARDRFAR